MNKNSILIVLSLAFLFTGCAGTQDQKTQMWGTVLNTVLGVGLIATQAVTKTPINNPFNNTQNQYAPVGYQQNYNPCNQFTPENRFPVENSNQYTPVANEVYGVRF